jgi:fructose-1-phosphate kinase PfkB-like protein
VSAAVIASRKRPRRAADRGRSQGAELRAYGPVALIKPNAGELAIATDRPTRSDAEVEAALAAALDAASRARCW